MATLGMQYTAPIDVHLGQITEVDMVDAGMTVLRTEQLLPPAQLAALAALPKAARAVAIGRLSTTATHAGLAQTITHGIHARVNLLLATNGISNDRILAVKRDAVFVTGPPLPVLRLPDGTQFRVQGSYTAFAKLGQVEVYAVPRRGLVVLKGIPQALRALHQPYMTQFVVDVLSLMERQRVLDVAHTLQVFRRDYVERRLPLGFYREYNGTSAYAVRGNKRVYQLSGAAVVAVADVDLSYNLQHVILPLARSIL